MATQANRTTFTATPWPDTSRARREFVAKSFDRAVQTSEEALESARSMAAKMRSGKPLQRAPAR